MGYFEDGYNAFSKNMSYVTGTNAGADYVNDVQDAIDKTVEEMKKTVMQRANASANTTKGFIAEDWHAGTFNVDVAAKGGKNIKAEVIKTNDEVTDIIVDNKGKVTNFQSKYYKTPNHTAKELSHQQYDGTKKVGPSDQFKIDESPDGFKGINEEARKLALKNQENRPEVAKSYQDTADNARSVIEDAGFSSKGLSDQEAYDIAVEIKNGTFDPKKYNLVTENFIKMEYVMRQAVKAGMNAALITAILKTAPEIYKILDGLIKRGFIDDNQLKKTGRVILSSSAEGFLRGSCAAAITAICKSGLAGVGLKAVNATYVGIGTAIMMNTMKRAAEMATGNITKQEFAAGCTNDIFITTFSVGGGILGQQFIPIPVLGAMFGSFIGGIIGTSVYNGYNNLFMSFCIDSGFTFFGIVDQDYKLPKEILKEIGIETYNFNEYKPQKYYLQKYEFQKYEPNRYKIETIDIVMIRRGVIGINKIGYQCS